MGNIQLTYLAGTPQAAIVARPLRLPRGYRHVPAPQFAPVRSRALEFTLVARPPL
jgi:hypothetical protein